MKETQRAEWKETWRDEFLRWICGFANAEGGVLHIGRNSKGVVVGVANAARLLEEIPNKVRDILGIVVDLKLRTEGGKEWLEIVVEPHSYPVSYKGEYHVRSGSTKLELKGAALDRFLLRKQGRTWDGVPVPRVSIRDLSRDALANFRKLARQSRRIGAAVLREPNASLVDKLNLFDGAYLKRAAVLLFHPDPERWFTGAFVKIGYFRTESDLLYHDEIHGDLFTQAQKTLEVLLSKYLKAAISYRGIQRVETLPVPEDALREAILNAIIHRDYAVGAPIQMRVYEDRLRIWNPGELPEHWSLKKLLKQHSSHPFNPSVDG
jgi:ATP-dependent DNA helicase RecG